MSLEVLNSQFGKGGTGIPELGKVLHELQGHTFSLLTGAAADTKINLAAIRTEDTVLFAMNNNAGTLSDITNTISIVDVRASGTLTISSTGPVADETFVVNGVTYTFKATKTAATHVKLGATINETAANIAATVNSYETRKLVEDRYRVADVVATANSAVVTFTAVAEGTGGNSITLAKTATNVAVSGATLSGGTATGGIKSSGTTNQVLLVWYNKTP